MKKPLASTVTNPLETLYVRKGSLLINIVSYESRDDLKSISDLFVVLRGVAIDLEDPGIYEVISLRRDDVWEILEWSRVFNSFAEITRRGNSELYRCIRCDKTYDDFEKLYRHFMQKHSINSDPLIRRREILRISIRTIDLYKTFSTREKLLNEVMILLAKDLFE